ncbi:Hypothetical predicted protein [Mytilus galloprovincialis]|uniref:RING-type domain-containing protein n=1 Tax=Mytilus galloprovincialis TaxID=29158 RepID=A0A8B6DZ25_MYTGA|nr:Hypothetical predicted protein [Mytilus galloprovincialis]
MAIPWTDDTNQDREQLRIGTDELDSQSNFTNYNFVSQSRSARELRSQSNTERHDDDAFIGTTHSRMLVLQRENLELRSKLNCFICKQKQFTHVLLPCSHVVCGDCVKLTMCSCGIPIESSHVCTLTPIHTTEHEMASSVSSLELIFSIDSNNS